MEQLHTQLSRSRSYMMPLRPIILQTHAAPAQPCQHLRRPAAQVDPNLAAKSMGKIEDDVPALFKRLRYPFGISKSALFAVGSPHTWPGLLAALTWLVELLNYEEKAVRHSLASSDSSPTRCRYVTPPGAC